MASYDGSIRIGVEVDADGAADDLKKAFDDMADSTEAAEKSALSLSDIIKGNLLSEAIVGGVRTLANAFRGFASDVVSTGSDFDTAMSQVAATMGTTVDEIQNLSDKAREMGAATSFSATEAAEGLNILAMAGLSAEEQVEGIGTVLDLAAAGAISMDSAASYAVGAVKGFSDSMGNAGYYADLMAKGATLANTSVEGLGEALSQSAATASAYGQEAESVTLSLLRLAEQNVTGSEAATALNRAMADLYTPTDAAKSALEELGVSAYDSTGTARDFNEVVDDLSSALSGMSAEEAAAYSATIFTTQGLSAFNKMTVSSTETIERFADGLSNAAGSAANQAATQLDNLAGDLTILDSALSEVKISLYEGLSEGLRTAAQAATEFVSGIDWASFGETIGGFVSTIIDNGPAIISVISGIGAGFAAWNVVSLISSIVTAVKAFQAANEGAAVAQALLNVAMNANPIGIIVTAIAALVAGMIVLWNTSEDFRNAVTGIWEAIAGVFAKAWDIIKGVWDVVPGYFENVWNTIKGVFSAVQGVLSGDFSSAWEAIKEIISGWASYFGEIWDNIKDIFSNAWEAFKDIGTNIVDGIKEGIADAWNSFKDWVGGLFGELVDGVKELLGIHSPSKVFAGIGDYMMQGMAKGIVDGGKEAVKSVENIMSELAGIPAPDLSAVASDLSGLAERAQLSRIPSLGNLGNLGIPAIAAGRVIPTNMEFLSVMNNTGTGYGISADDIEAAVEKGVAAAASGIGGGTTDVSVNFSGDANLSGLVRMLYPHIVAERNRRGLSLAGGNL